jgi:phage-related protein
MAAISIPLITEFKDTGIKQAIKEFKKLETAGQKAQFLIKKAAVPATAALAGVTAVIGSAVKAAIEDQAAQASLARQIKASTKATDKQIKGVEEYISSLGQSVAIADDEARPALQALVVATKDVTKAQDLLNVAIDISAGTGKDLATVSDALAKAYAGNMRGLQALSPELKAMIKDGASLEEVLATLETNFGGAGKAAADTAAGGMKKLGIAFNETKESIGMAFLPIFEKLLPVLQTFSNWAQKNPELLAAVVASIGLVSAAIIAMNIQLAITNALSESNPVGAIIVGVVALGVAVVAAYKKFEGFRNVVRTVVNGIMSYVEFMVNGWIKAVNVIIKAMNLIPGVDIKEIGSVSFGRMGGEPGAAPGVHDSGPGMTQAPTLSSNDRGMGGSTGSTVTVNVQGADPNAVVQALQRYVRTSGPVPVNIRNM